MSHTTSQTPSDDDLDNTFNDNYWLIDANLPQAQDDVDVPLPSFEVLEEPTQNKIYQLKLSAKARIPSSGLYESDNGPPHRHHQTIPRLQQFFIPQCL